MSIIYLISFKHKEVVGKISGWNQENHLILPTLGKWLKEKMEFCILKIQKRCLMLTNNFKQPITQIIITNKSDRV